MSVDLSELNAPQREAAECVEGPLLVLAGAGSGKTRVLTYRIAHMVQDLKIAPWSILAITFTNKAAKEMKERVFSAIGSYASHMWILTFHAACCRILKANAELLGFTHDFTIYDTDDKERLIKQCMADLSVNTEKVKPKVVASIIGNLKNDLVEPGDFVPAPEKDTEKVAAEVYYEYQKRLKENNAMDFDDLLVNAYILFRDHADVLENYQDRFQYVLVDEYQDTNHAQYEICNLLAKKNRNLMVVGDDDQSIYSWRGADIQNILDFEKDYPEAKVVKLEQNYRSTSNILNAANSVISHNANRKSKTLYTNLGEGDKIGIYSASDERDEGRWIAGEIEKAKRNGEIKSYSDVAILYRTNAQSRVLEDMMLRAGIPYVIVGGTKFFDRAEIRDVVAYLNLAVNENDTVAFERVVNKPRRGIGEKSVIKIRSYAEQCGISCIEASEKLCLRGDFKGKVAHGLMQFVNVFKEARNYSGDLEDIIEMMIEKSGLIRALEDENTEEARGRIGNIKELLTVAQEFKERQVEEGQIYSAPRNDNETGEIQPELEESEITLADFIEWVRLRTDLDNLSSEDDNVTLMTCHSSKGLEYDYVFVAGMEDGIFPSDMKKFEPEEMEEERRLAYVSITRAKKKLVFTHAQSRRIYGTTNNSAPSQFLREIPEEYRQTLGVGSQGFSGSGWEKRGSRRGIAGSGTGIFDNKVVNFSSSSQSRKNSGPFTFGRVESKSSSFENSGSASGFSSGDAVEHKVFGKGIVKAVDGDKITIKFMDGKERSLLKEFAPIVKVN